MSLKVLILYANSGSSLGHEEIAKNYAAFLGKLEFNVITTDVLHLDRGRRISCFNLLYSWTIKNLPWLWRWLYYSWNKIPLFDLFRTAILPLFFRKSRVLITRETPDIVITTHPTATAIANHLKSVGKLRGLLITAFSDWHFQSFWVFPNVDLYLVATPEQALELSKIGVSADHIEQTGILLGPKYYEAPVRAAARSRLGLPPDERVILVMGGGRGWRIEEVLLRLSGLRTPVHIFAIGGSDKRKREIERSLHHNFLQSTCVTVAGFIDPSIYFAAADLLVSKPGCLTTAQAILLSLPTVIVDAVPGQEEENAKVLCKIGAVLPEKGCLGRQIDELLSSSNPGRGVSPFIKFDLWEVPAKIEKAIKSHLSMVEIRRLKEENN